ncbi:glycosyltransferase [Marinactinospora thermotolerans]|uniref:UDP-N-acetylglucosamine transferase subunit ALG13 n=1 Tax=Marinactinospora thermotolerans DSM 45154 TaxID=1122192 RepID=A0A1T4SYR1_9ACTN|nr:glycosyltransferase [Marinactinospora thermotolerans]SKA33386.1 UDP-N-acetylglucosamine transferase subunit ALG13 [Marinactinospora thermotolerans DSM 45154]
MTELRIQADPRPLILVTVGTDHHPFDRLIDWIDAYAEQHPGIRVLVQHGATRAPSIAEGIAFLEREWLDSAMRRATAVVTHGGPATITEVRRHGRLPISVARDPELGEHVDDHQLRFVARLDEAGMIRSCASSQQLWATLDKALKQPDDFVLGETEGERPDVVRRAGSLIDLLVTAERGPVDRPLPPPAEHTEMPDVTVVVPTRDRPELLRRTLRAIAVQDYPGRIVTLVVYDHDEPDHSLAEDGGDRPVRVVTNTHSPGLAGARNTGVLAAETDLVAFCDDDDTWLPSKLRRQVEVLLAEPETEIVCCGIRVAYEATEADRILERTTITFADLLRSRLTELHPSTFVIRRDAMVHGCGTVSEEIPGSYGEDYELLLRLARRAAIRNVPEVGVRVLWHPRSHFTGRWQTISTALRWLLTEYPEFRLVRAGYARVAGQIAFAEAAAGRRRAALAWAAATLRARPREPRAYLALAVACGVSPNAVLRALHLRGKGV